MTLDTNVDVSEAYRRAKAAFQAGDYATARDLLVWALSVRPEDLASRYALGLTLARVGDLAGAETAFVRVLANDRRHAEAAYNLGRVFEQQGRVAEAAEAYQAALAVRPVADAADRLSRLTTGPSAPASTASSIRTNPYGDAGLTVAQGQSGSSASTLPAPTPSPGGPAPSTQGGPSLAATLDTASSESREALRGALVYQGHRMMRSYVGSWVITIALIASAATVLSVGDHLPGLTQAARPVDVREIFGSVSPGLLALAALVLISIVLRARSNGYRIYERRAEITAGVLRRKKRYVWYYDVVDVSYQQPFGLLLSGTARIDLEQESTHKALVHSVTGVASARAMSRLFDSLHAMVLRERRAMKKQFV